VCSQPPPPPGKIASRALGPEKFAKKISSEMCKKIPLQMGEKGLEARAEQVYVERIDI
jgi:hypothetical protein